MHSGNYFLGWIRELLAAKGKTKFGDLRNADASDPKRAYKLQVIASDLSAPQHAGAAPATPRSSGSIPTSSRSPRRCG